MEDYPNNSRAAKSRKNEDQPKAAHKKQVEKVVTGNVVRRKAPLSKRFLQRFAGESSSIGEYIVKDVLVPATKDMLHDAVLSYMDRMLFGDSGGTVVRRRRTGTPGSSVGRINYGTSSTSIRRDPREDPRRPVSRVARTQMQLDEVFLETRVEAEEVLDQMMEHLQEYDAVTVADFYGFIGEDHEFTDNKWGWYDLTGAKIRHISREGYLLDLPKPIPLD